MRKHCDIVFLSMLGGLLILLAGCGQCVSADGDIEAPPEVAQHNGALYAACKLRPSSKLAEGLPKVYGQVLFKQEFPQGTLEVFLHLNGLPTEFDEVPRAVHIHQYGDLSQGCVSTGGHYDPHGENHPLHPGDFGNFESQRGKINAMIQCNATLFGRLSVIGRAVVIHEKRDDLGLGGDAGSLLHGNAGQRLGCCVIGISTPILWNVNLRRLRRN